LGDLQQNEPQVSTGKERQVAKTAIVVMSVMMVIGGLGCAALSSLVTPATIDRQAVKYVVDANVATAEEYAGYPNLDKATRLVSDVDAAHTIVQLDIQQQLQRDDAVYSRIRQVSRGFMAVAAQREEAIFGPQGLLSLGLGMAGMGTLTGFLGLMRKRPGDVTSAELEQALAEANGSASTELTAKQRQFAQVVQGVGALMKNMDITRGSPLYDVFSTAMNGAQDTDTQIAVSVVKKELGL